MVIEPSGAGRFSICSVRSANWLRGTSMANINVSKPRGSLSISQSIPPGMIAPVPSVSSSSPAAPLRGKSAVAFVIVVLDTKILSSSAPRETVTSEDVFVIMESVIVTSSLPAPPVNARLIPSWELYS